MQQRKPESICHCGSGKVPGTMRDNGWCCGVCYNDFKFCQGPTPGYKSDDFGGCVEGCASHNGEYCNCTPPVRIAGGY